MISGRQVLLDRRKRKADEIIHKLLAAQTTVEQRPALAGTQYRLVIHMIKEKNKYPAWISNRSQFVPRGTLNLCP
jgi:hypothetical protein